MITLPSHGQVYRGPFKLLWFTGRAEPLVLPLSARGDVFGKQAGLVFAEFLLLLLVFPLGTPVLG
uniref:Uncharacterized protein n=1 Tax=Anguilla anguilla TaxID=7936 RepID=A0A0E9VXM3_ANGAN